MVWTLALSAWAAFSGAAWLVAEHHADRVEREAEVAVLARAEVAAEAIEQSLLRTLEAVESLHSLAQSRQRLTEAGSRAGAEAMEKQLATVARYGRFGVIQVAIIGPDGRLAWTSAPGNWQGMDLSDREHFRVHRDGREELFVSAPLIGRVSAQCSVQLTRPIRDGAGRFAGVAVVSIDPIELSLSLAELRFGEGGSVIVLRRDGVVLACNQDTERALGQVLPPDRPLMAALAAARAGSLRVPEGILVGDRMPKLVGYRALLAAPLAVAVALDREREMAPIAFARPALRASAAAMSALALAVAGLALLWLERRRTQAALELARRERESALERLAQAQRMEALGRLAGGIAHDFNNVLQAVLGGARMIQRCAGDAGEARRLAAMVAEAAERGASVTRRLLAFARRGELSAAAVAPGPLLAGLREGLAHTLGAEIRLRIEADPALPPVLADRGQLETVLVNLAVNARDAMAPLGGGTLTLSARVEEVAGGGDAAREGEAGPGGGLAPGRYLRLAVADTGTGMDAATLARAAEPFFTTKPLGQGTGLGLAMAKGFAEQSGGAFGIESEPGRGTVVTLWLPLHPGEAGRDAEAPAAAPEPPADPRPAAGERRILLVDDEGQVRAALATALRERGHLVEEAADGRAALRRLGAAGGGFDLLVTDLAMPGMDGLALLREARRRCPGLPALLVTGHAGDADARGFAAAVGEGPLLLLRKPIDPDVLAERVAALLHGASADAA